MDYEAFNTLCESLPATTHVIQWGGAHVWKVGGKVFAIGGWEKDHEAFTFKVSETAFQILGEMPGLRPAPYLASRGLKWIQHYDKPGLPDHDLEDYIRHSHVIVTKGLSLKRRRELGIAG